MSLLTYFSAIAVTMVLGHIFVMYYLLHTKTGTLEDKNWAGSYYYKATFITVTILAMITLFTNPDVLVGGEAGKEVAAAIIFGGVVLYLLFTLFSLIILLPLYSSYSEYKKSCLGLGFELKDHIGKFIITTRKDGFVKTDDPAKWEVEVFRVVPEITWRGNYAETVRVATLKHITQEDCNKETISELAKKYFSDRKDFRSTYLVEDGDKLTEQKDDNVEIIVL